MTDEDRRLPSVLEAVDYLLEFVLDGIPEQVGFILFVGMGNSMLPTNALEAAFISPFNGVDEIDEKAPLALIRIKNWKGEKSSGINTYFLELLDEADVTIEVDDEAEGEPEEKEEEKPAASGRTKTRTRPKATEPEPEPEQEEEEEVVISKDDYVEYKPPRSRKAIECQVVSSNKTKEECTLVAVEDESKKFTAVKWDDVVLLVEE